MLSLSTSGVLEPYSLDGVTLASSPYRFVDWRGGWGVYWSTVISAVRS